MVVRYCVRLTIAGALLGAVACAATPRDPETLQAQRTAELDRLGQQVGMGYAKVAPTPLGTRNSIPLRPADN
jgi:hypothetical protein